MRDFKFKWTEEKVDLLKKLWDEGHSASVTASKINRKFDASITRNAVIGKVNRLGLRGRKVTTRKPLETRKPRKTTRRNEIGVVMSPPVSLAGNIKPRKKPKTEEPAVPPTLEKTKDLSVLELTSETCKFSVGRNENGHVFCGCKTRDGSPYCDHHYAICIDIEKTAAANRKRKVA